VELSTPGRRVRVDRGFLKIAGEDGDVGQVPLDGITALVASTPAISITGQAIAALSDRGAPIVFCGPDFRPTSFVIPVTGHHAQGNRLEAQAAASLPTHKRLWAEIVKAKLTAQADALHAVGVPDAPLRALVRQVKSGDPDNREATGAQRYWTRLFGADFRRNRDEPGINAMLNYGYTIVRAATARGIIAAGLHPALGICHKSRGDGLRLADDMMEPFRPAVDLIVRQIAGTAASELTPDIKRKLVGVLASDYLTEDGRSPLSTVLMRTATQLAQIYAGERRKLAFPNPLIPLGPLSEGDE
jgi:CRISPR-associated protein Cas1